MKRDQTNYCVIGAGCGGQAIAGYLASRGQNVKLYNRSPSRVKGIRNNSIELTGKLSGEGSLTYVGTDISQAVQGSDVIMVVTPATAHRDIAKSLAPHLSDGQMMLLNPGRTYGALEVTHTLKQYGCDAKVIVAEAATLIYATRTKSPGVSIIKGVKTEVSIAAVVAENTQAVLDKVNPQYPQFVGAKSFLDTSFGNIGAIFHPAIILGNKDKITHGQEFDFYTDGVTPRVAETLAAVDHEISTIAAALGAEFPTVVGWLHSRYGIPVSNIRTMLTTNPVYQGIKAPETLDHRYLWEDVPTGLVPISEMGEALNIPTPTINSLINQGSDVLDKDFKKEGRTLSSLGLSNENLKESLENLIKGR